MTLQFGFELEGFTREKHSDLITIPPTTIPVDGFPGLVELRNTGGDDLFDQLAIIAKRVMGLRIDLKRFMMYEDFQTTEYKFSGQEMAQLRRSRAFHKDVVDIQNIYGRQPRRFGNRTLASFQVNVSNQIGWSRTERLGDKTIDIPARYGLLDIKNIVKSLDEEFEKEIKESNRQPGMYAIKDNIRLEYRSLPNSVFDIDYQNLLERLRRVFY